MASDSWQRLPIEAIKANADGAIAIGPFGSRMRSDRYVAAGVPVIRGNNIADTRTLVGDFVFVSPETADELRSSNVFPGDLVFPHRGAIGRVGMVPPGGSERYVLSTSLMKLTCDPGIVDPRYVFYFFRSPEGRQELLKNASTVGTPGIGQPLATLRSIVIPVPPLLEQRKIASTLAALDDKIDLNRRIEGTIEDLTKAIFKSWFVDFDPLRSSATGTASAPARGPDGMFPDAFDDPIVGVVPGGWSLVPLVDVVEVNPPRSLRKGQIAPYLGMANMPTGGHSPDRLVDRSFVAGTRFENGDTLVARITPCLENGKTAFVDFLAEGEVGWGSTEYIVLRPRPPMPPEWAYCLARSDEFRAFAIQSMTGSSGRQRVPADALSYFNVASPPGEVAEAFGRVIRPLLVRARAASDDSRALSQLRDSLLPRLISRQLPIPHLSATIEQQDRNTERG